MVNRGVVQMLAALAICAGLLAGIQYEAKADYQFGSTASTGKGYGTPDSNRYVPEYYGGTSVGTCYNNIIGYDDWYADYGASYGPIVHYITYDPCEMDRLGATSAGWSRLYAHERAHSRAWAHGEAPASLNAAYYKNVNVN